MSEISAMLYKARQDRQQALMDLIKHGERAEDALALISPILSAFKAKLVDNLCITNPDYQKVDNTALFALHCELKVVSDLQSAIQASIDAGIQAKDAMDEDSKKSEAQSARGYRF